MPTSTTDAVAGEVRRDIEYARAGGEILLLDAHIPAGSGPFPGAIVVHGGGWVAGDRRTNVAPLFRPLLDAGFACLSISYRLARQLPLFGAAVEDVQQAVEFARSHAPEFQIDPARLALIGESAGGHLAAMAVLRAPAPTVKALVGLYTPSDLQQIEQFRRVVAGTPLEAVFSTRLRDLSPIRHVRAGMPPVLLIHGTADRLVPFEQSRNLCRAIRDAGAECDLMAVNGGEHGIRRWESAGQTGYKRLMIDWLKKRVA